MTNTSVIILSHQPGEWLEACITSVVEQADEVIVIDNGSAGRSVTHIAEPTGVRVVRSEQNLGYAAGVNLGIRSGQGDLVALLNEHDSPADHRKLGRKLLSVTSGDREVLCKLLGAGVHELEGTKERAA